MAWDHLAINKPHLVYIILGGFTSLFMLCSTFIKERLYIGEATVATICGLIFGPHAANLIDPNTWGNVDQITLEFSRIVLVVQCFAVGVELPKYYMEKHWRSVTFLLIPVMTFGWLITSLFIWWMIPPLDWLQALCCAACVTATDPVLASSVVGKGKFAKRIPKHLRDILSAESGCNDGMAFPFIYLALYIIQYRNEPKDVAFNWICVTILYECIFGAVYGFLIGYIGRRGIRWAEEHDLIDRESFLVFYFVLALFCAGSGSILGVDDLLVGFAAGVGFSNDGWFTQKTEESHVSNVIDLLINLAYFVYFGTIVPWDQFNSPALGTTPWRLVVIAIFVILFRRIPIMMALKPLIPDIKTWREALFAGHFGPIGVGAIFVAILARADLETGGTTPLSELPSEDTPEYALIALIWPITTFLVVSSIIVHGSSIAVFTLGKRINTLHLTMSYTKADEDGPSWMNRLPRIASQSKSMSKMSDTSDVVGLPEVPPGTLPPVGLPGAFLRRQKEEDNPSREGSRTSSLVARRRKKKWEGYGPGGPISQSAIAPTRRSYSEATSATLTPENSESQSNEEEKELEEKELRERHDDSEIPENHKSDAERHPTKTETYEEGDDLITEDADGNVISVQRTPQGEERDAEIHKAEEEIKDDLEHPGQVYSKLRKRFDAWRRKDDGAESSKKAAKAQEHDRRRGPALAYQFGNTIIVEDEDGEVVKKYELPSQRPDKKVPTDAAAARPTLGSRVNALTGTRRESVSGSEPPVRQGINRMGTWTGLTGRKEASDGDASAHQRKTQQEDEEDDRRIRFTIGGSGKRMTKQDFLREIQSLDPKARAEVVASSNASPTIKALADKDVTHPNPSASRLLDTETAQVGSSKKDAKAVGLDLAREKGADVRSDSEGSDSDEEPYDEVESSSSVERPARPRIITSRPGPSSQGSETAAERRRRLGALRGVDDDDGNGSGSSPSPTAETPAERRRREALAASRSAGSSSGDAPDGETAAERRRREAALGVGGTVEDDSDDDNTERVPQPQQRRGIRFAEEPVRGRK